MRAVAHYREAEHLLDLVDTEPDPDAPIVRHRVATAAVHATLALAGATAMGSYVTPDADELAEWELVAGGEGT